MEGLPENLTGGGTIMATEKTGPEVLRERTISDQDRTETTEGEARGRAGNRSPFSVPVLIVFLS